MKKQNAIVIGAGIAGIASAIRLAVKGYNVSVFEANSYPGGKLTAFKINGYRFDAGPSLFTMPQYVTDLFKLANKNPEDYFKYQPIDIACHYFWEDATTLHAFTDLQKLETEVQNKLGVPQGVITKKLADVKLIHQKTGKIFMEKSLHKTKTWWSKDVLKALVHLPNYGIFSTMHQENQKLKHPKLVQLFDRYATYNGSSPYQSPGIMNVIPHLEFGIGTFFPKGGMHQITLSLVKLAEDLGVQFNYNQKVSKIEVENHQVKGVFIKNQYYRGNKVVCNMDVYPAYKYLLSDQKKPVKTLKQERSSSALIYYWGIKKEFKQLGLHNILFSNNYQKEFEHLFKTKTFFDDPTVYINITSKYNNGDAPAGCENWFVMINAPSNEGQYSKDVYTEARNNIVKKINKILQVNIETHIEVEEVLTPETIESKTFSYQGSLYGASSNNKYAAFIRHPNFSPRIKNLYFVGGSVHPGGGIPLCLMSAKIATEQIEAL